VSDLNSTCCTLIQSHNAIYLLTVSLVILINIVVFFYKFLVVHAFDAIVPTKLCRLQSLLPNPFPDSRYVDSKIICYFVGC
jgi:hypothetical protein